MKIRYITILLLCAMLTGCADAHKQSEQHAATVPEVTAEAETVAAVIRPLPDAAMESLDNCILNISFEQNDFYQDESGNICLRMRIYTYDKYDMVDISALKTGDTILLSGEEILVSTVERNEYGTVLVNGGLDEGGFDLATDDDGVYYVHGYSDMKSWYLVGETKCEISDVFALKDSSNLDLGTVTYKAEDFLQENTMPDFGFFPQNTTARIDNGRLVEMNRIYTP